MRAIVEQATSRRRFIQYLAASPLFAGEKPDTYLVLFTMMESYELLAGPSLVAVRI